MKIYDMPADDRPMERLLAHGAETLSNSDLLAILIRTGSKQKSAIDLAREVLEYANGSLTTLGSISLEGLCTISGLGKGKAANIIAALEIGRRYLEEGLDFEGKTLKSSEEVFSIMLPKMKSLIHEELWAIWLNSRQKIIGYDRITSGGSSSTVIDSKLIIKKALEKNAAGLVIVHNHPSGIPMPSKADINETATLKDNCAPLGITIHDHIIMSNTSYFSFADAGITKPKSTK